MITKLAFRSTLAVMLFGLVALSPLNAVAAQPYDAYEELSGTHRPNEALMPKHMPRDKNAMVSKQDYLAMAGKMWDMAVAEMKVKDMKKMSMPEYNDFYKNYLER